ncbi:hypothetical protein FA95DRAFT_1297844 [Auriscalpium vulgare]|uniref:Uncharacterized protein n=1 Tax=Auriscalpium vulgare TaxID=40419 RepID=A0ACB8R1Y2_9AGAM|nr:hypothetical protein FA95DRAFT_1297844 [Auriscalpium vulgare]
MEKACALNHGRMILTHRCGGVLTGLVKCSVNCGTTTMSLTTHTTCKYGRRSDQSILFFRDVANVTCQPSGPPAASFLLYPYHAPPNCLFLCNFQKQLKSYMRCTQYEKRTIEQNSNAAYLRLWQRLCGGMEMKGCLSMATAFIDFVAVAFFSEKNEYLGHAPLPPRASVPRACFLHLKQPA